MHFHLVSTVFDTKGGILTSGEHVVTTSDTVTDSDDATGYALMVAMIFAVAACHYQLYVIDLGDQGIAR